MHGLSMQTILRTADGAIRACASADSHREKVRLLPALLLIRMSVWKLQCHAGNSGGTLC
jgi:hypothetical protein